MPDPLTVSAIKAHIEELLLRDTGALSHVAPLMRAPWIITVQQRQTIYASLLRWIESREAATRTHVNP